MRLLVHGRTLLNIARCLLALSALAYLPALRAQEFSEGPLNMKIEGALRWNGLYAFQDVYCLRFPDAEEVSSTVGGLLANDTISYFRATYQQAQVKAYIVTSTLPKGRSEDEEFLRLVRSELDDADRVNAAAGKDRYFVTAQRGPLHPVVVVRIAGITENDPNGRFPVARPLLANDVTPFPHSTHRFFVRNGNRFEVAVLGEAAQPNAPGAMTELDRKIDALADRITESVQRCRSLPSDYSSFAQDPAAHALPTDLYPEPDAP